MKTWIKIVALSALVCGGFALADTTAQAAPWVYQTYYSTPYGAYDGGSTVVYRRPLLAPRVAYYAPPAVYAPTTTYYAPATTVYRAPAVYGVPGYVAPVYGAPTVTNYPSAAAVTYPRVNAYYGGVAPLPQPAVVYPLPTTVYPPAVLP